MATTDAVSGIYTIGHSNVPAVKIIDLLLAQGVQLLVDVRSVPYGQYTPQFNRETFAVSVKRAGIRYEFEGDYLGGRPTDPSCYKTGRLTDGEADYSQVVDYYQVMKRPWFAAAIDALREQAMRSCTAIMCSEEEPRRCHRHLLIAQTLLAKGPRVVHIRGDGRLEEAKLLPEADGGFEQQALPFWGVGQVRIYTIGFTKKTAEQFFGLIRQNGIERVVDIRLHPNGQLAGFAKRDDLPFFLAKLAGCEYRHLPVLAPSEEILSEYRKDRDWNRYWRRFELLMAERDVPRKLDSRLFEEKTCCLLCSEATPEKCHRRLIAEMLAKNWRGTEVTHLI